MSNYPREVYPMPKHTGAYAWLDAHGATLNADGRTDAEIARKAGCVKSVVCAWRKKHGIAAVAPAGSDDWRACMKRWCKSYQETLTAIEMGLTDKEAAKMLGLHIKAWTNRRYRHGLPPGRYEAPNKARRKQK